MADLYGNIPISDEPDQPTPPRKPSPPKPAPKRPSGKNTALLKRWYVLTPLLLLLLAAGYYIGSSALMPVFIEKHFPQLFHKNTGLNLSIASSRFNPLDFSIVASGIDIDSADPDGTRDVLSIGDLYVDLDFISLLRHGIVSESLIISDAAFTLIRYPDQSYNISQFFSIDRGGEADSDVMNFAELPFLYSLNNIAINDSTILFKDMRSDQQHLVENLDIDLPTLSNFSFDVGNYIEPRFSAVINGSPVELTGETALPAADGEQQPTRMSFTLQDVDLSLYAGYFPMPLPVNIEKGRVSGSIALSFLSNSSAGRQLNFGYQLQIEDGIFSSHDGSLILTVPLLNIEGSLDPLKSDITVGNLLLRDPALKVAHHFSAATVDSLLLGDESGKQDAAVPLDPPSVTIDLFIADNGRLEVETAQDTLAFTSVQFSMRKYSSGRDSAASSSGEKSSFRLSGESANDFSLFTWQGHFEDGAPVGEVEINNLPFSLAFERLLPENGSMAEGSTDIRGRLSLRRDNGAPIDYRLENGMIRLSKIVIADDRRPWLQSSAGRLSPVTIDGDTIDLGNLILENAQISLQQDTLPAAVDTLLAGKDNSLQGIDVKGAVTIHAEDDNGPPLELEKVHFQVTDLHKGATKKDNFALSAEIDGGGSVKATGKLRLSPFTGSIDLGFSGIAAASLFPAGDTSPFVFAEQLRLSGSGAFDIEGRRFKGSLETSGGRLTHRPSGATYSFDKAAIASASATLDWRDYNVERVMLKNLSFSGDSLQLTANGASVASLERKGDDLRAGELVLADTEIILLAGFSSESLPFASPGKGNITFERIALDGRVSLVSADNERREIVPGFTAEVSSLGDTLPKKDNLAMELQLVDGGTVSVDGALAIAPVQTRLDLNLRRVPSHFFAPLVPDGFKVSLETLVNGDVDYFHPQKMVAGDLQLDGGRLYSDDGADLAGWNTAILSDFKYTIAPMHLGITKLTLDAPRLFYADSGDHPLLRIRRYLESSFPAEGSGNAAISFSRLDIVRTDIQNGVVDYLDERMSPAWQEEITSFSGFINNYHLSESSEPVRYGVSGKIGGGGFAAHGSIIFTGDDTVAESVLEFKGLPLSSLEDQLEQSFALQIDSASADVYCTFGHEDGEDRARLTVSSLTAADAASPLAMTIALLSDSADSFSETFSLQKQEKPLYDQIVNHFQKLVVKTSVSPYLLLPEGYAALRRDSTLTFVPGETALSPSAAATLDLFALLVEDHPRLRLILNSLVDANTDRSALRARLEEEEQQRVKRENAKLLQQWKEQKDRQSPPVSAEGSIVEKEIAEEDLQAFAPISAEPVVVTEAMLENLGRERLEKTYAFLLDKHDVPRENIGLDDEPVIGDHQPQIMIELDHIGAERQTDPEGTVFFRAPQFHLSPAPPKTVDTADDVLLSPQTLTHKKT